MKRIGSVVSVLVAGMAASVYAATFSVETIAIDQGFMMGGAGKDLMAPDGHSVTISPNGAMQASLTFDGTVPNAGFNGKFTLYSNVSGRTLRTIEFYNFTRQRWVTHSIARTDNDTSRGVTVKFANGQDYCCDMSGRVKARVTWASKGNFKWAAVDYAEWNFSDQP